MKKWLLETTLILLVFWLSACATSERGERLPASADAAFSSEPSLESPVWPMWAHQHWVWENEGTTDSANALVDGYLQRDIPVSAIILDRPWDINASDLIPDPKRYPNFSDVISGFHAKNVKVMLWSVSLLNQEDADFAEAKQKNYFINNAKLIRWWGGHGALVDYKNPAAVDWWHKRMDRVLDMGIDGWKLDAIDPFVVMASSSSNFTGYLRDLATILHVDPWDRALWAEYSNFYYGDYWEYSRAHTGKKINITARPVDRLADTDFRFPFAPYKVSFAGWVGDQEGDWGGLNVAIKNMKLSAEQNFLSFGSDTTGFRHTNGMRDPELYARWTEMSAFNSVFENGGDGEHRPWIYGSDTENLYRKFVKIHEALVPYIYSSAAWAYEEKKSIYQNYDYVDQTLPHSRQPAKEHWNYRLGPNLFVAVIDAAGGERSFAFPDGDWINLLQLKQQEERIIDKKYAIDEYPVFVRNGAILPVKNIANSDFLAPPTNAEGLTAAVFPVEGEEKFPVYSESDVGGILSYNLSGTRLSFTKKHVPKLNWLRVQSFSGLGVPKKASVNGASSEIVSAGNAAWIATSACGDADECTITVEW